jgi:hypothetical protein
MEHPAEHLEHLEHQKHAAHDPFDKRVAMTMAIVAACLAAMTMLGHRAHNETLRYRIEAGDFRTQAANQWSYYQAKNIRQHAYQKDLVFLNILPKGNGTTEEVETTRKRWQDQLDKYGKELPQMMEKAKGLEAEAAKLEDKSKHTHHLADHLDLAELGVELALVLCSLAVLTKRRAFWFAGIISGALGVGVGIFAYVQHLLH